MFNRNVSTPLGVGVASGPFAVLDQAGNLVTTGLLVRLPINEMTGKARGLENCMTPHAEKSGLWVFPLEEVRAL